MDNPKFNYIFTLAIAVAYSTKYPKMRELLLRKDSCEFYANAHHYELTDDDHRFIDNINS